MAVLELRGPRSFREAQMDDLGQVLWILLLGALVYGFLRLITNSLQRDRADRSNGPVIPGFSWPDTMDQALRRHVRDAVYRLDPARFRHEPDYVAALMGRLDGVVYTGHDGRLEIRSVIATARARASAESLFGSDFAVTVLLEQRRVRQGKAILGQAKRGPIETLAESDVGRLADQCSKMLRLTRHCIVLETPRRAPAMPQVLVLSPVEPVLLDLDDYLADKLLTCEHGDGRSEFVSAVSESTFTRLRILVADRRDAVF